jgi:hypothetical protein
MSERRQCRGSAQRAALFSHEKIPGNVLHRVRDGSKVTISVAEKKRRALHTALFGISNAASLPLFMNRAI